MATIVVLYYDPRVSFYPSVCAAVVFFVLCKTFLRLNFLFTMQKRKFGKNMSDDTKLYSSQRFTHVYSWIRCKWISPK